MAGTAGRRVAAIATALALGIGTAPVWAGQPAEAKGTPTPPRVAQPTKAAKADPVDKVATPRLSWYGCYGSLNCTTVKVPLDYDQPKGATVELALLRRPADKPKQKIGTLFVNPGGPGGQATALAAFADQVFSQQILDRFDIVGMDPRGIGYSQNVQCFPNAGQQAAALAGYQVTFPLGAKQEKAWLASDKALGTACSKTTLATSMSTAEVARDMELMRRAVHDKKLSYFGFSYGTYLGQVYASMFPTRFRAVGVDGVLDPVAWAGDKSNADRPLEARLNSSVGASKALTEILRRCDRAGGAKCSFAPGDPVANAATIMARLRAHPAVITEEDDEGNTDSYEITYADVVGEILSYLYDPEGYTDITDLLTNLWIVTEPPSGRAQATRRERAGAEKALVDRFADHRPQRPTRGFPYDNSAEATLSVICTDSTERTRQRDYPAYAAQQDEKAPYFGRLWTWGSSACAGDAFRGEDEDAYRGPFNVKTAAPVLYVGDYYDPATNYQGAVSAAKRMPNSRLLSSDSFGHTAYGTSACTTKAVDAYLLSAKLPRKGTVCKGDIQPFQTASQQASRSNRTRMKALSAKLPASKQGFRH